MNEFEIINKYLSTLSVKNKGSYNLKNDVFFDYKKKIVISVDTYIEKKHFVDFKKPKLVIKKIFRSALSDLVCKGVSPKYYFLSASGNKKNFNKNKIKQINKSLNLEQKKFKIDLVGGDTTNSKTLSFTFVIVGYSSKIPITRNDVRKNDDIYVTGNLGDSFIGLKSIQKKIKLKKNEVKYFVKEYYNPRLQIAFSKKISSFAHASIDISDGLYQDMNHLIKYNNLEYYIDMSKIPISKKLTIILKRKKINKNKVISCGDDYQILFTSHKKFRNKINNIAKKNHTKVTRIGIIKSKNKTISNKKLINSGYIHKF